MLYFWLQNNQSGCRQLDALYMAAKRDACFAEALNERKHREEYWHLMNKWSWKQDYVGNLFGMCSENNWPAHLAPDAQVVFVREADGVFSIGKNTRGTVNWLLTDCDEHTVRREISDLPCSLATFMRNPDAPEFRVRTVHLAVFDTLDEGALLLDLGLPSGREVHASSQVRSETVVLFSDNHGYPITASVPLLSDVVIDLTGRTVCFEPLMFKVPWALTEEKAALTRRALLQLLTDARIPDVINMTDQLLDRGRCL